MTTGSVTLWVWPLTWSTTTPKWRKNNKTIADGFIFLVPEVVAVLFCCRSYAATWRRFVASVAYFIQAPWCGATVYCPSLEPGSNQLNWLYHANLYIFILFLCQIRKRGRYPVTSSRTSSSVNYYYTATLAISLDTTLCCCCSSVG